MVYSQDLHSTGDSALLNRGYLFFRSGRYDSSILAYEQYLSGKTSSFHSSSGMSDHRTGAGQQHLQALLYLGTSYNMCSEPGKALVVLQTAIKIAESGLTDERTLRALLYYQSGNAYLLEMDFKKSIQNYQNALVLVPENDALIMKINQNLGGIFFFKEDYDNAIEHFQKALYIQSLSENADPSKTAELLINTGAAFAEKQEFSRASEYFSKAESLLKRIRSTDSLQFAGLSVNLGNLLLKMNMLKAAYKQFVNASLVYRDRMQEMPDQAVLLFTNIARLCEKKGIFDSALYYYNLAVSFIHDNSARYSLSLASLLCNIGETYRMQENWDSALSYYQKAEEKIFSKGSETVYSSSVKQRTYAEELELFRIREEKARTLFLFGLDIGSDNNILTSFNEYLLAIGSADVINKEFGREGSRLFFNESVKNLYYGALETGFYLSTHTHKEIKERLFLINEKSRNRILLSDFMDQVAKKLAGVPDSLLIKNKMLNDEISLCVSKLSDGTNGEWNGQRENYLFYLDKLIELKQGLDSLQVQYENSSALYRKIKEQEVVNNYMGIQQELFPEEALIEYFIGDSSLFIFAVRPDSLMIRRIPLSSNMNNEISEFIREIKLADQKKVSKTGHDLYRKLIQPVNPFLLQVKKLIIIPDETLATIPFEALVTDECKGTVSSGSDPPAYLLNRFEINYQYSSRLWFDCRRKNLEIEEPINFSGFAPVNFSGPANDCFGGNETTSLSSLPYSGMEIQDIADLIIRNGGKTHLFLQHDATEKNFRYSLENTNVIHVATHSVINDQQPAYSGLVFCQDENEEAEKQIFDGILYLDEIFNLRISADLLVLSSCATGTGKITKSEGVLAMTRGFFTSGASNIVYTLWNITDKNTRNFMVSFYKGILDGQTYSCALRNAKIEMISKPETSLPRLWAPYVLLGK